MEHGGKDKKWPYQLSSGNTLKHIPYLHHALLTSASKINYQKKNCFPNKKLLSSHKNDAKWKITSLGFNF
jgi:hypothetical protein